MTKYIIVGYWDGENCFTHTVEATNPKAAVQQAVKDLRDEPSTMVIVDILTGKGVNNVHSTGALRVPDTAEDFLRGVRGSCQFGRIK